MTKLLSVFSLSLVVAGFSGPLSAQAGLPPAAPLEAKVEGVLLDTAGKPRPHAEGKLCVVATYPFEDPKTSRFFKDETCAETRTGEQLVAAVPAGNGALPAAIEPAPLEMTIWGNIKDASGRDVAGQEGEVCVQGRYESPFQIGEKNLCAQVTSDAYGQFRAALYYPTEDFKGIYHPQSFSNVVFYTKTDGSLAQLTVEESKLFPRPPVIVQGVSGLVPRNHLNVLVKAE